MLKYGKALKFYAKGEKLDIRGQILYDSVYEMSRVGYTQSVVARDLRERRIGSDCLMGIGFPFGAMKIF